MNLCNYDKNFFEGMEEDDYDIENETKSNRQIYIILKDIVISSLQKKNMLLRRSLARVKRYLDIDDN